LPSSAARLCCILFLATGFCLSQEPPSSDTLPSAPSAVAQSLALSGEAWPQDSQTSGGQAEEHSPNRVKRLDKLKDLPLVWLIGPYVPSQSKLTPLSNGERREVYLRQTYLNAGSYLARAFAAGIDQARGTPYQWGGGFGGYGRRFASRYGQFVVENSLVAAGNAGLGYEPRYDFCRCQGFWPRTRHAIARNFYTYNSTENEKRPQIALYAGAYAAGAISSTWMPGHQNPWKNGAFVALQQVGYGSAINWVSEFALDILRKTGVKK
jgi:hypothetical protein